MYQSEFFEENELSFDNLDNSLYGDLNENFHTEFNNQVDSFFYEGKPQNFLTDNDLLNEEEIQTPELAGPKKPKTSSFKDSNSDSEKKTNYSSQKSDKIFEIEKDEKDNKILGKKKKRKICKKRKFFRDNILKKINPMLFDHILKFINNVLKEYSNETQKQKKIKYPYYTQLLLKINSKIKHDTKILSIRNILNSKLKDIFSNDISQQFKSLKFDYNKKFIEKISKDNTKLKINKILEMKFVDCVEHLVGAKHYKELEGLEKQYNNMIDELKLNKHETDEYIEKFKYYLNNYVDYYQNTTNRAI